MRGGRLWSSTTGKKVWWLGSSCYQAKLLAVATWA